MNGLDRQGVEEMFVKFSAKKSRKERQFFWQAITGKILKHYVIMCNEMEDGQIKQLR